MNATVKYLYLYIGAALLAAMVVTQSACAAPVRTNMANGYVAIHDAATGRLDCESTNPKAKWKVNVTMGVKSPADWSGVGTSSGPVFVHGDGNTVSYTMLRFRDGGKRVEKSGESLTGGITGGRLVVASWVPKQYGAIATVVTLQGNTETTTEIDINAWGTHKVLSKKNRHLPTVRETLPTTSLSFEMPPGFDKQWDPTGRTLALIPRTGLPVGILLNASDGGVDLTEFADIFMRDIGPALGSNDMKTVASQSMNIANRPGLLRIANGSRNGKRATFAFVFVTSPETTVLLMYMSPSDTYDQHASIFYRLLSTVQMK